MYTRVIESTACLLPQTIETYEQEGSSIIQWPEMADVFTPKEWSGKRWQRSELLIGLLVDQLATDPPVQGRFNTVLRDLRNMLAYGGVFFKDEWHIALPPNDFNKLETIFKENGKSVGNARGYGIDVIKLKNLPERILTVQNNPDDNRLAFIIGPVADYANNLRIVSWRKGANFSSSFGNRNSYLLKKSFGTSSRTIISAIHASIQDSFSCKLRSEEIDIKYIPLSVSGNQLTIRDNMGDVVGPRFRRIDEIVPAAMLYALVLDQRDSTYVGISEGALQEP